MSWLYNHRHQLDGLEPLLKIAYWAIIDNNVPQEDRDDVEQIIVLSLIQTVQKYGNNGKVYLKAVARYRIYDYFNRKYKEKRFWYIQESEKGEKAGETWLSLHDGDTDARLDASATLATLPKRLVQIGYKILNGEKLSVADNAYRIKQKSRLRPKLNFRRYANRLSDLEKRRILQLYREDMFVHKIALAMGRDDRTILRVLARHQLPSRRKLLGKERDERIRHAYFVDGKGVSRIKRELGYSYDTVYKAIRAGNSLNQEGK